MKAFLIGGAATVALVAIGPAIAQVAPAAPAATKAAKVHTRADVQAKVAEHFAKLDANRDGFVTRAEADAAREQLRARIAERVGERREQAFERLDSNNDGAISRSEWDAASTRRTERMASRRDRKSEGGPDARRMHGGVHRMAMLGGRMFGMADADKDGRVSLQEAQSAALRHFDMADTNRDGQISPDERRQMRHRMISERRPG